MSTLTEVRAAKQQAWEIFGRVAKVSGVGIRRHTNGDYVLKVNLTRRPSGDQQLPDNILGVPVEVDIVGPARSQPVPRAKKPTT